jgi:hypothetical protein
MGQPSSSKLLENDYPGESDRRAECTLRLSEGKSLYMIRGSLHKFVSSTPNGRHYSEDKERQGVFTGVPWVVFLVCLFGMLGAVALVNYLVDPYGRYGTDVLGAHRIDPRSWIVFKLSRKHPAPNVLLFGSSRCLSLNPNYGPNHVGLNVALYGGAIEDYYSILRYAVEEMKDPVRWVVMGLEADLMVSSHPIDPMLRKNKKLSKYLKEQRLKSFQSLFSAPEYVEGLASLLSLRTLEDSFRVIFGVLMRHFGIREASANLGEEGDEQLGIAGRIFGEIVEQKDSMEARLRQYKALYSGSVTLDRDRIDYLRRFAAYAEANRIRVLLFFPGYSESFWKEISKSDAFENAQRTLGEEVAKLANQYGWRVLDFRPGNWVGPNLEFFDGVHPTKETIKIINRSIEGALEDGF